MNEIAPPPAYRLNLRVVLMSFLIRIGTFLVFAGISVTLAMTTNAPYFLFILMGLAVSTLATTFYKPEGPREPMNHRASFLYSWVWRCRRWRRLSTSPMGHGNR
ncbi:hypothetical protein MRX96_034473 [Rhipicephalus microplus]